MEKSLPFIGLNVDVLKIHIHVHCTLMFAFPDVRQRPALPSAAHLAHTLEPVCVLQPPERSRPHHRHVPLLSTVPECHPDHVSPHPALPDHSRHHQQDAQTYRTEGSGQGYTAGGALGFVIFMIFCEG